MGAIQVDVESRWEELRPLWWETTQVFCRFCGRLIPRHLWLVRLDGADVPFCDPDCERHYRQHVLAEEQRPDGEPPGRPDSPFGRFGSASGDGVVAG
jgi:hypothetical protein